MNIILSSSVTPGTGDSHFTLILFTYVLGLLGIEFIFFIAAHMVLCSKYAPRTTLINAPIF